MRRVLTAALLAVLVVASVAASRFREGPSWKYRVVRLPADLVERDVAGPQGGKGTDGALPVLESLGRDGWELVAATKSGTDYLCFFKSPQDGR